MRAVPFRTSRLCGDFRFPGDSRNGSDRAALERTLGLKDTVNKNAPDLAGVFVVQAKMRVVFHYIERIAEFA